MIYWFRSDIVSDCTCKYTNQCVTNHFDIADSKSDTTQKPDTTQKDWKTASEHCRTQNDSLVDIQDIQNNLYHLKGLPSIWSSVRGQLSPWIAYRGCFYKDLYSLLTLYLTKKIHYLESNTVGNCYFKCKMKNETYGACVNNAHFFFGLYDSMCLCLCDISITKNISGSAECHSCGTSGGLSYFSLYETINVTIPDAHFGGFCLMCGPQKDSNVNKSVLYSIDCNWLLRVEE